MKFAVPLIPVMLAVSACATVPVAQPVAVGSFAMVMADGRSIGTISLVPAGDGYALRGTLAGLPPGTHGIHLHTAGHCDGPAFTTAGSHLNPALTEHGSMNPKGPHLGDLPNLVADAAGHAAFDGGLVGTRADLDRNLFDADGTALVIHAAADDYRTDPSGNSGGRIACAVLARP